MAGHLLSLTNPRSVLSAIGKIGFAQFCTFSCSQLWTFTIAHFYLKKVVHFPLFTIVNFQFLTIVYFLAWTNVHIYFLARTIVHIYCTLDCAVWPVRKSSGVPECQHQIVCLHKQLSEAKQKYQRKCFTLTHLTWTLKIHRFSPQNYRKNLQ